MGIFSDRMDQDLQIRGYSPRTRTTYLACAKAFVAHFHIPPDKLGRDDLRSYQLYLINERRVSWCYFNQTVAALRFLYRTTLECDWDVARLPYQKGGRKLPLILSEAEVAALLDAAECQRDRAILMTFYGCGVRLAELQHLRIPDIDSGRMVLHVRQGKGKKDRDLPLPQRLLPVLRAYWKTCRPQEFLFPGAIPGQPLSSSSIQNVVRSAAQRAGLTKPVTPHVLRHCFATHLLEHGANVRQVQLLLGHRSLNTTMLYLHLTTNSLHQAKSPLDELLGLASNPQASRYGS